jgi:serine/threonine-protein kinase HipA
LGWVYLLIERYDRYYCDEKVSLKRAHQEDFCQALRIVSERKYQPEGGPSLRACFALIRQQSEIPAVDLNRLLDAVLYNYFIGNNDAHGKNFSFLYKKTPPDSRLRIHLSPLYDLVSTESYTELSKRMAMSIGGEYHSEKISMTHFEALATEARLSKSAVRRHLLAFADKVHSGVEDFHDGHTETAPIKSLIQKRCLRILS